MIADERRSNSEISESEVSETIVSKSVNEKNNIKNINSSTESLDTVAPSHRFLTSADICVNPLEIRANPRDRATG